MDQLTGNTGKLDTCKQLTNISNSIPAGIVTVDGELRISWYNRVWAERFNLYFSKPISIAMPFFTLIPDDVIEKLLIDALAGKTISSCCHEFPGHEAEDRYYDLIVSPIKSEKGEVSGAVLTALDVTERHHRIRSMESAKNEAEFYVDLMSHDIRNFNQVTMGYIELLQLAENMDPKERSYLEKAQKGVTGSNKLIDNIKKIRLIRQFAGKDLRKTDLDPIIKKDVADVEKTFPSAKITLDMGRGEKRMVMANDYINEIFRHILENAMKYDTNEKKIIDVTVSSTTRDGRDYWSVRFADHGPGIPDEKKKSIFERMGSTTHGAGVGLSIVNVLVNKYGGRIYVEDRVKGDPSKGSVFIVELPCA